LTSVTIGNGVTSIGDSAFDNCSSLASIRYTGTIAEWKAISKVSSWNGYESKIPVTKVVCSDGEVAI